MQVPMDPSERKKPLTLNLPPIILEELTEAAWQHRCSKSVLAERAIRAYLRLDEARTGEPTSQPTRRYTGPGHLEETGYIPEGSSEERGSVPPGDE